MADHNGKVGVVVPKKRPWNSAKMSHALRYELREPVAKAEPNKSLKWVTNSPAVGSLVLLLEIRPPPASVPWISPPVNGRCNRHDYSVSLGRGYNLGQNKMEQQTPIPPKPRMKAREGQKRAIFQSLIWGGGGSRFSIYFVQDSILDEVKWNSKPPSPQIKNEGARRAKTRHFSILDLWGRGGLGFPFILSKIVARNNMLYFKQLSTRSRIRIMTCLCLHVCLFIISTRAALSVKNKTQLFAMVAPQIWTARVIGKSSRKLILRLCHAIGKGP